MALVSFGFWFKVLIAWAVGSTSNFICGVWLHASHFHDRQRARSGAAHEPPAFPLKVRKRQHVIGRIIARMKGQQRNTLNDSDIRRYQIVTGRDCTYINLTPELLMQEAKREYKSFRPFQPPQPAARLERLADFAEYAYWREMARLRADQSAA